MRGVAADFLSVEHMDLAKPRDGFLAETSQWDVNQLPAMLSGEPSPGGSGSRMAEHGDVAFPADGVVLLLLGAVAQCAQGANERPSENATWLGYFDGSDIHHLVKTRDT